MLRFVELLLEQGVLTDDEAVVLRGGVYDQRRVLLSAYEVAEYHRSVELLAVMWKSVARLVAVVVVVVVVVVVEVVVVVVSLVVSTDEEVVIRLWRVGNSSNPYAATTTTTTTTTMDTGIL